MARAILTTRTFGSARRSLLGISTGFQRDKGIMLRPVRAEASLIINWDAYQGGVLDQTANGDKDFAILQQISWPNAQKPVGLPHG